MSRTKGTHLSAMFRRIASRRGAKRAIVALAHSILISAYYMWKNKPPYQELGDTFLYKLKPEETANFLVCRKRRHFYFALTV